MTERHPRPRRLRADRAEARRVGDHHAARPRRRGRLERPQRTSSRRRSIGRDQPRPSRSDRGAARVGGPRSDHALRPCGPRTSPCCATRTRRGPSIGLGPNPGLLGRGSVAKTRQTSLLSDTKRPSRKPSLAICARWSRRKSAIWSRCSPTPDAFARSVASALGPGHRGGVRPGARRCASARPSESEAPGESGGGPTSRPRPCVRKKAPRVPCAEARICPVAGRSRASKLKKLRLKTSSGSSRPRAGGRSLDARRRSARSSPRTRPGRRRDHGPRKPWRIT